jgi:hypothetical protein
MEVGSVRTRQTITISYFRSFGLCFPLGDVLAQLLVGLPEGFAVGVEEGFNGVDPGAVVGGEFADQHEPVDDPVYHVDGRVPVWVVEHASCESEVLVQVVGADVGSPTLVVEGGQGDGDLLHGRIVIERPGYGLQFVHGPP